MEKLDIILAFLFFLYIMMMLLPVILVVIFTGLIGSSLGSRWDMIIIALMITFVLVVMTKMNARSKPATDTNEVLKEIHSASV
jgi:hypothetical protein